MQRAMESEDGLDLFKKEIREAWMLYDAEMQAWDLIRRVYAAQAKQLRSSRKEAMQSERDAVRCARNGESDMEEQIARNEKRQMCLHLLKYLERVRMHASNNDAGLARAAGIGVGAAVSDLGANVLLRKSRRPKRDIPRGNRSLSSSVRNVDLAALRSIEIAEDNGVREEPNTGQIAAFIFLGIWRSEH